VIWAVLALLGVPLWLCAIGIVSLLYGNRTLRKRHGDLPVRFRSKPGGRWRRGHGIWVNDVFGFRGSPAAWSEALLWVVTASARNASDAESKKLHRLGDSPVVVELGVMAGDPVVIAGKANDRERLLGPFVSHAGDGESKCADAPVGAGPAV
jgi:hypothetical protein